MSQPDPAAREPLTIRVPPGILDRARQLKGSGESLNELIVSAIEREVRRREALQAHAQILRIRQQVRRRTGPHPDAADLIRAMREGEGRGE